MAAPVGVLAGDWDGAAVVGAVLVPSDALGVAVAAGEGEAAPDGVPPPPPDALPEADAVGGAEAQCVALAVAQREGGGDAVALPRVGGAVAVVARSPLPLGEPLGAALRDGEREAAKERERDGEGEALREGGGDLLEEPLGEARADASELAEGGGEEDALLQGVGEKEMVGAPVALPEADALSGALKDANSVGAAGAVCVGEKRGEGLAVVAPVGCTDWVSGPDSEAGAEGVT